MAAPLPLTAVVARRQSTLRRVLALQVGEVLTFERGDGAQLAVAGQPLLTGEFGVFNGNNAVSVTGRVRRPTASAGQGNEGERV